MTIKLVNDHKINVPENMTVRYDGMFDAIEYRGFEIITFETGNEINGEYIGPFNACNQAGDEFEAETLPAIAAQIDAIGGAK